MKSNRSSVDLAAQGMNIYIVVIEEVLNGENITNKMKCFLHREDAEKYYQEELEKIKSNWEEDGGDIVVDESETDLNCEIYVDGYYTTDHSYIALKTEILN